MVEYAVLLAFVAVVAGVFFDDNGIKGSINGSFDKVLVSMGILEEAPKENTNTLANFLKFRQNNPEANFQGTFQPGSVIRSEDNNPYLSNNDNLSNLVMVNNSKWYVAWTDIDLSKVSDGDYAKCIVYSYSGNQYFIQYLPVENGKIKVNQTPTSSSFADGGHFTVPSADQVSTWYYDMGINDIKTK